MKRTPPTFAELRQLGERFMDRARSQLFETGNLVPIIHIGDSLDGEPDLTVVVIPEVMGHADQKTRLCELVSAKIAQHGYNHAVSIADTYLLKAKGADESIAIVALRRGGYSTPEIHEMFGLGVLTEQIMVSIQTIDREVNLSQEYTRRPDKSVISFAEVNESGPMSSGQFKFFGEQMSDEEIISRVKGQQS